MMDFRYAIDGTINGGAVSGAGNGRVVPSDGICEMNVDFEKLATGWDPRSIVLMCCSRAFAVGAFENGGAKNLMSLGKGYVTIGRHLPGVSRRGVVRDDKGTVYADISASSDTQLVNETAYDVSRIEGGYSKLQPGVNGIASIEPFSGIMMQAGPNVVTITTSYRIHTEDGQTMHGFTFYPHYLPYQTEMLDQIQRFDVEVLDQSFKNGHLYLKTFASVSVVATETLTLAPAHHHVARR